MVLNGFVVSFYRPLNELKQSTSSDYKFSQQIRFCSSQNSRSVLQFKQNRNRFVSLCSVQNDKSVHELSSGEFASSLSVSNVKKSILDLSRDTNRGAFIKNESQIDGFLQLVETLVDTKGPDSVEHSKKIDRNELIGKWDLLFSTEKPLLSLIKGMWPFPPASNVYQLVYSLSELTNVVGFGENKKSDELRVIAKWNQDPNEVVLRCSFRFLKTEWFRNDQKVISFPFAIGSGYFDVLYLDAQLRIDRDKNGWINVYAYSGPPERCSAYDNLVNE
mmetsp:Transcript_13448/g.24117  ORF Transcript_13448/g.24117 Transcript_13448/m.24117 type:complete len:275 (+) Transcript_13448:41-865(+)